MDDDLREPINDDEDFEPLLPASVPGRVRCLSCQQMFDSPDRVAIRRCEKCKRSDGQWGMTIRPKRSAVNHPES